MKHEREPWPISIDDWATIFISVVVGLCAIEVICKIIFKY